MKITNEQLIQIIKEELSRVLDENNMDNVDEPKDKVEQAYRKIKNSHYWNRYKETSFDARMGGDSSFFDQADEALDEYEMKIANKFGLSPQEADRLSDMLSNDKEHM